jgi:hypothetical protein
MPAFTAVSGYKQGYKWRRLTSLSVIFWQALAGNGSSKTKTGQEVNVRKPLYSKMLPKMERTRVNPSSAASGGGDDVARSELEYREKTWWND